MQHDVTVEEGGGVDLAGDLGVGRGRGEQGDRVQEHRSRIAGNGLAEPRG
jgi:hypothetical protein